MQTDEHDERERAIARHRADAERAEQATLWVDAAAAYEQALSLLAGDPARAGDEVALLTALGRCYWFDGQARPSWRTLRRAIALAREQGDAPALARATVEILRIWGPADRQRAMADEALAALGDAEPHMRALLLLRTRRQPEAIAIGEAHGFEDILEVRESERGWVALDEGRTNEFVAALRRSHDVYARLGEHSVAVGRLRGAGFSVLQLGDLREGVALAVDARAYARKTHLRFDEQLALMDVVAAEFCRCDFARCEALLAETPGDVDFRADLYRMWMALHRDDIAGAMRLLVEPSRGGGAQTAISQIHAAAAGMLHAAGDDAAASRELEAWAEAARVGESFAEECAVPADALVALGSDALVREVRDAIVTWDARQAQKDRFLTLQGRGLDAVRGTLALRLVEIEAAAAHYAEGLAWAEREGCPVDAGRCLAGLAHVAEARGDAASAQEHRDRARAAFAPCGAAYELRRLGA